jgi:hypothetical protein
MLAHRHLLIVSVGANAFVYDRKVKLFLLFFATRLYSYC